MEGQLDDACESTYYTNDSIHVDLLIYDIIAYSTIIVPWSSKIKLFYQTETFLPDTVLLSTPPLQQ